MVKKTIVAIIAIVLLVVVFVGASHRWGYTRYGAVYSYGNPSNAPSYVYPYGTYHPYQYYGDYGYPTYTYPYGYYYPGQSEYMYRYGAPTTAYPYSRAAPETVYPYYPTPQVPRGQEGQLCGAIDERQYGCEFGYVCDYTKGGVAGLGVCSISPGSTTTYPYQVGPSTTYPYYYS